MTFPVSAKAASPTSLEEPFWCSFFVPATMENSLPQNSRFHILPTINPIIQSNNQMKTEVTQRTYFSSYGTFRTRYCSLESLQIYIVIWVHCAWKENFTTYLFSAYYENTKPCQRICSKVHWNLLLFWAMEFPDTYFRMPLPSGKETL